MKYTYKITLIGKDKDKKETIVYIFNYLEMVTIISKVNPDYYNIKVEEKDNVMNIKTFLETEKHLLTYEFWSKIKNTFDDSSFGFN